MDMMQRVDFLLELEVEAWLESEKLREVITNESIRNERAV